MAYSSSKLRASLYLEQAGRCPSCKAKKELYEMELDHVMPKSLGGADHEINRVLLCRRCNKKKGNRLTGPTQHTIFDKPTTSPKPRSHSGLARRANPGKVRDKIVGFRITRGQFRALSAGARRAGQSLSEYLFDAAFERLANRPPD